MAGIYIHIPYCKKKCPYCDFYSVGNLYELDQYSDYLIKELVLRKSFLGTDAVETIYLGGGTPSLIPSDDIEKILCAVFSNFKVIPQPEITIEVNPDDVSKDLLKAYKRININRISVGVQSFIDSELEFLGRRHDAIKALTSISLIQEEGFENISIDLIYGIPGSSYASWEKNLLTATDLNVMHLSCYHLSFEEDTLMFKKVKNKEITAVSEDLSLVQFGLLREIAGAKGFEHYEVSNFARNRQYSKHNTSYWIGAPYLGLGPGAHSFNSDCRFWNPRSLKDWKSGLDKSEPAFEGELLTDVDKFNELLLTRLRTIWGLNINLLRKEFDDNLTEIMLKNSNRYLVNGMLILEDNYLKIPAEYFFVSDRIISDLMIG